MTAPRSNKRPAKGVPMKALIATASVAATLAGWALLPANDPPAAASPATTGTADQPAVTAPDVNNFGGFTTPPQSQDGQFSAPQAPSQTFPSLNPSLGQGSTSWPRPSARSRSSR